MVPLMSPVACSEMSSGSMRALPMVIINKDDRVRDEVTCIAHCHTNMSKTTLAPLFNHRPQGGHCAAPIVRLTSGGAFTVSIANMVAPQLSFLIYTNWIHVTVPFCVQTILSSHKSLLLSLHTKHHSLSYN
jgi:hypothetical protein